MPYKVSVLKSDGIIQTELVGEFSKQDISDYIQDLLKLEIYHQHGRLLVDYAGVDVISADFNEFNDLTDMISPLQINGREIWQAGINADPVFKGISRQVNTLLEIKNQHVDKVNLKFFDTREEAKNWLLSKPID